MATEETTRLCILLLNWLLILKCDFSKDSIIRDHKCDNCREIQDKLTKRYKVVEDDHDKKEGNNVEKEKIERTLRVFNCRVKRQIALNNLAQAEKYSWEDESEWKEDPENELVKYYERAIVNDHATEDWFRRWAECLVEAIRDRDDWKQLFSEYSNFVEKNSVIPERYKDYERLLEIYKDLESVNTREQFEQVYSHIHEPEGAQVCRNLRSELSFKRPCRVLDIVASAIIREREWSME